MNRFTIQSLLIILATWVGVAHGQNMASILDTPYPSAVKYLPAPPDSLSMAFANDMHQYFVHKSLRDTERGQQALIDVGYGAAYIARRMEDIFGLNPADTKLPELRSMFTSALTYINQPSGAAKSYYNRRRPFDRFGEPLFSNESAWSLRKQGSYPSAHAVVGWAAAMLLSEINPKLQDDLYESGFEYGQSRLIVGAHWQSDVDAARMMTAATFARLHANEDFLAMMTRAQAIYDSVTHNVRPTALDQLHPMVRFLPQMPDSAGAAFAHDVATFYHCKALRAGDRGMQAVADADMTVAGIGKAFASLLGINISATTTPRIHNLLTTVIDQASDNCMLHKQSNPRTPPCERLNEPPMPGTMPVASPSCYPSQHATVGWAAALALMDVCPTRQNEILKRGREYGQSRVIAGTNWQSDVDAGQLLGGMVFATLTSDPDFRNLLTQARQEYNAISSVSSIQAEPVPEAATSYTLDGRCANADSHGVIVFTNGKKEIR